MLPLLTIILPSDATESSVGVGGDGNALFPEEDSDPDMTVVSASGTTSAPSGGDVSYSDFGENQGCYSRDIFFVPRTCPNHCAVPLSFDFCCRKSADFAV